MKKVLFLGLCLVAFTMQGQQKKLWANSFINQNIPTLKAEEWIGKTPDTKDKFILIQFWATWCGTCKNSIPILNKFHQEFPDDLVVIGLSEEDKATIEKLKKPKMDYYSAIDSQGVLNKYLGVRGLPHCVLIDPKGFVRWEGWPQLSGYELTTDVIKDIIKKYK